jgi:hypothetical protein
LRRRARRDYAFANTSATPFRERGEAHMTTLIIGGTGFIGRRLIPLLAKQGED